MMNTKGSAIISECGEYRYVLTRKIPSNLRWVRKCVFVMLNPSKADATKDDNTLRRCISLAAREGCTDLSVVNLYALRSTDPTALLTHPDPVGPHNLEHVQETLKGASLIIAAWGGNQMVTKSDIAKELLSMEGVLCLGKTKLGHPRHPLYTQAKTPLILLKE